MEELIESIERGLFMLEQLKAIIDQAGSKQIFPRLIIVRLDSYGVDAGQS